ncbi:hypothetical protein PENSPDRAFT_608011 [Peniophora sp. CONT]|nr:hypothetical protein PENSPDRAFT_608011 [Peniophora sp. CONT]
MATPQATHFSVLPVDVIDTITQQLDTTRNARASFLRLPHPRTSVPTLFLPYRRTASTSTSKYEWDILEVQSVSPPGPRSWFLDEPGEGAVVADGKLLVMTPIDPAFILIPLLLAVRPADNGAGMFRPLDEVFDGAHEKVENVTEEDLASLINLDCVAGAMRRICDVQDVTPELAVFRYSESKLLEYLRKKTARLAEPRVSEISKTIVRSLAKDGLMDDGKEELLQLGRVKAACNIISQYIPPPLYATLLASHNFAPLDAHIRSLADEQNAAMIPIKTKDTNRDEDGVAGKKRKGAKAEKPSNGVQKLQKASTKGMSKLSTFFTKK